MGKKKKTKKEKKEEKEFKISKKIKLPKYSARKAVLGQKTYHRLVQEGRTGYFNKELMEEARWLS